MAPKIPRCPACGATAPTCDREDDCFFPRRKTGDDLLHRLRWWLRYHASSEDAAGLVASAIGEIERLRSALEVAADTIHSHLGDQRSEDGWKTEEVRDAWLKARALLAQRPDTEKADGK